MPNPFNSIASNPNGHFLLHFYGGILRLLRYIERMDAFSGGSLHDLDARFPFLAHYRAQIEQFIPSTVSPEGAVAWWEEQIADWQASIHDHLPLAELENLPGVGRRGRAALLVTGVVEEDSRLGTLLAQLQEPLPARRPTLELIGQLLSEDEPNRTVEQSGSQSPEGGAWEATRELFQMGALETLNPDAPRAEWMLRAPAAVWDAVRDSLNGTFSGGWALHSSREYPSLEDLILPQATLELLRHIPDLLQTGQVRLLVLRASAGSERMEVAGAVARSMNRVVMESQSQLVRGGDAVEVALESHRERAMGSGASLGVLCTLAKAIPIFNYDLGPGETANLPELSGYNGPLIALMGAEGGLRGGLADQAVVLELPVPNPELRLRYWQSALGDKQAGDLPEIARRFILPGGYIRQTATMALAQARIQGRDVITAEDVRQATRALNRQMLDSLTERIDAGGSWSDLVVGPGTLEKLLELEQRCHFREELLDHLGPAFGKGANHGVRALFSGVSGTGKTLAARILAAELGMDLYRVDLASVINKYIGETEKNLHRVLSRAEELDVILLLDEGDSLLGNRTEVKNSNDRYANLETNYLLQRLENYQGIILVTSNAAQNIDTAFQRRMDVVVNFVPPLVDERWSIWQLHLPQGNAVSAGFLMRVAALCSLTGGQIRNAALLATLLQVQEGADMLQDRHLEAAVRAEYRKAGAVCPLEESQVTPAAADNVSQFIRLVAWSG